MIFRILNLVIVIPFFLVLSWLTPYEALDWEWITIAAATAVLMIVHGVLVRFEVNT